MVIYCTVFFALERVNKRSSCWPPKRIVKPASDSQVINFWFRITWSVKPAWRSQGTYLNADASDRIRIAFFKKEICMKGIHTSNQIKYQELNCCEREVVKGMKSRKAA